MFIACECIVSRGVGCCGVAIIGRLKEKWKLWSVLSCVNAFRMLGKGSHRLM